MSDLRNELSTLLDRAISMTKADFGNIQLVEARDASLRIFVHRGFEKPFLEFFRVVKHDMSSCAQALQRSECVVIRDVRKSPLFTESARRALLAAGVRACQSTPVVHGGRVIAMVNTHFRTSRVPTRTQLRNVDRLAKEVAQAMRPEKRTERQRADVRRTIEELHDSATGKARVVRGSAA